MVQLVWHASQLHAVGACEMVSRVMQQLFALVVVAALSGGNGAALASAVADPVKQVDALLRQYDRTDGGGVALGVYRGGEVLYAKGVGMADLESLSPNTARTIFPLASVSKQFTAFAILLLAREGKLDLDADVRTYLPYVPDFGRKMTTRHLLLHTSGLREMESLFWLGNMDVEGRRKQSEMRRAVAQQRALNFAPGSEYAYCNTGYELLAELVKAVTGKTLREFSRERIFAPLQMNATFVGDDASEVVVGRATSYCQNRSYCEQPGGARREVASSELIGSSNTHSTVLDLARWAGNLSRPVVGDRALMEQFLSMGTLDDGSPINYGFGLWRETVAGHPVIMHTGQSASFFTVFVYFPQQDFALAVLANTLVDVLGIAEQVAALYLPPGPSAKPQPLAVASVDVTALATMVGLYSARGDALLELVRQDNGLAIRNGTSGQPTPVTFRADGTFDRGDEKRSAGEFYRIVRGRTGTVVAVEDGGKGSSGRIVRFERVAAVEPTSVNLRELVGEYRSSELDTTYTVYLEDGALKMRTVWAETGILLTPVYKDVFQGRRFLSRVAVERGAGGRVSALLASSSLDRNIRFDRVR